MSYRNFRLAFAGFALLFALPMGLWGCKAAQDLTTLSDAQNAADKAATAVSTIGLASAPNLTKAHEAACAGQALANTVTDMLNSTGHTGAAKASADVSTALGDGCTWKLPAL